MFEMRVLRGPGNEESGFMMAALLVTMSVMAVLLGALMPVWSTAARREREAELVFRGEQYARAIGLFQRKYANAQPPTIDVLVNERFLRKKYLDPITGGEFQILTTGSAMAVGGPGAPGAPGRSGAPGSPAAQGGGPRTGGPGATGTAPTTPGRGATTPQQSGLGAPGGLQSSAGVMGVTSKSTEASLRLYNGKQRYSEWAFMPVQMTTAAGGVAGGRAGAPNVPGAGGPGAGRGRGTGPGAGSGGLQTPGGRGSGFGNPGMGSSPGGSSSPGGFNPTRP